MGSATTALCNESISADIDKNLFRALFTLGSTWAWATRAKRDVLLFVLCFAEDSGGDEPARTWQPRRFSGQIRQIASSKHGAHYVSAQSFMRPRRIPAAGGSRLYLWWHPNPLLSVNVIAAPIDPFQKLYWLMALRETENVAMKNRGVNCDLLLSVEPRRNACHYELRNNLRLWNKLENYVSNGSKGGGGGNKRPLKLDQRKKRRKKKSVLSEYLKNKAQIARERALKQP